MGQRVRIKNQAEVAKMRLAGRVNAEVLQEVKAIICPGITTAELDEVAETIIRDHGGIPTFKGYPGPYPYPATLTVSINREMVHGIPNGRMLREGDIVSVDYYAWTPSGNIPITSKYVQTMKAMGQKNGKPNWIFLCSLSI